MYKLGLKKIVAQLEYFNGKLDFNTIMELPLPFLEDLSNAQIDFIREKQKAEADEIARRERENKQNQHKK